MQNPTWYNNQVRGCWCNIAVRCCYFIIPSQYVLSCMNMAVDLWWFQQRCSNLFVHQAQSVPTGLRPRPKFEIIWVCETPPIILYSDVTISPRFGGKRDVAHLIYGRIKPYLISQLLWQRRQTFPATKISDEIKFQNASKRQIKIIY